MRVLVTGAGGFLGRSAVRALQTAGFEVLATSRRPGENVEVLDATDGVCLEKFLAKFQPHRIVHLVGQRSERVDECARSNTLTSAIVLSAAEKMPSTPGIVLIGTAEEYGTPRTRAHREDDACQPISPYGITKNAATKLAFSLRSRVPVCVLRPATLYGPWQPKFQLVAGVVEAALENRVFRLHGGAANRFRDLLFVEDAANAIVSAVREVEGVARGEVLNISTGTPHSIRHIADRILALVGSGAIEEGPPPPRTGDHDFLVLDPSKARAVLQWSPTTALEQGLHTTVTHARSLRTEFSS